MKERIISKNFYYDKTLFIKKNQRYEANALFGFCVSSEPDRNNNYYNVRDIFDSWGDDIGIELYTCFWEDVREVITRIEHKLHEDNFDALNISITSGEISKDFGCNLPAEEIISILKRNQKKYLTVTAPYVAASCRIKLHATMLCSLSGDI